MSINIVILIQISILVRMVNLLNDLFSYLPEILINQYWIDLIVCIACMIFSLLVGGYVVGRLIDNIRIRLKQ